MCKQSQEHLKIIFTARDPSSAKSIAYIVNSFLSEITLDYCIISQPPATQYFETFPLFQDHHIKFEKDLGYPALFTSLSKIIHDEDPNLVITGVSGPDFGIDEIILKCLEQKNIYTFSVQNFWGDINNSLGVTAKTFLVVDGLAKVLTEQRCECTTIISGQLSGENIVGSNPLKLRSNFRKGKFLDEDIVICFFLQPLNEETGYFIEVENFIRELVKAPLNYHFIWRAHPKQTEEQLALFLKILEKYKLGGKASLDASLEQILCGVDIAVSSFSTVGHDLQRLMKRSALPIGFPLFLLSENRLKNWFENYSGLREIPQSENGLSVVVSSQDQLPELLLPKVIESAKISCWQNVNKHLVDEALPKAELVRKILSECVH